MEDAGLRARRSALAPKVSRLTAEAQQPAAIDAAAAAGSCHAARQDHVGHLLEALRSSDHGTRCAALRELCPCRRGRVRDLGAWREIFRRAREGGHRERDSAAHAIGTLTEKAQGSGEWRKVLKSLRPELDALMQDPRAAGAVLRQMKRNCNQSERRGESLRRLRRRRQALHLATPAEVAAWVNDAFGLTGAQGVTPGERGVQRLSRWLGHRVKFQPARATKDAELAARAQRYLPRLLQGAAAG